MATFVTSLWYTWIASDAVLGEVAVPLHGQRQKRNRASAKARTVSGHSVLGADLSA